MLTEMRTRLVARVGALLLLLGIAGAPAPVRALTGISDAPSDIPGQLWVGGSVISSVGGSTVDRVWRLELAQGRVALISLIGNSGSELGLYLFDGYTRSIVADTPIAQSAKPGGEQSLTATLPAGTYYIDVNGRNTDAAFGFALSVVLLADTTPPTLSLKPESDGAAVNSATASVIVLASDPLSGVATMRLRVDGGEWGVWRPAAPTASVQIPTILGAHKIEAQVTNGLGLVSAIAATSVTYDNVAPVATRTTPRADGTTISARPTITYVFSEPMRAASWRNGGLIVLSRSGSVVAGTFAYDAATRTGTWTPTAPLVLGDPYAVQIGGVVDLAGNAPAIGEAWVLQYQRPTRITVDATPVRTTYLSLRTIIGSFGNVPANSIVALDQRRAGGAWEEQATFTTVGAQSPATGSAPLRATFRPTESGEWRLRYDGDSGHRAAVSKSVSVKVSARLTLSGAGGYVRIRTAGATVQIRGTASPATSSLTLVRYRCNSSFTGCVVSARIAVTADANGAVAYAWKSTRGHWIWKLKSAAGSGLEAGTTGRLRFTVR